MSETGEQRRRRKFAAGATDQIATLMGGVAIALFTAGAVAPLIAALGGTLNLSPHVFGTLVLLVLLLAGCLAFLAVWVKGKAKVRDDDRLADLLTGSRTLNSSPTEGVE